MPVAGNNNKMSMDKEMEDLKDFNFPFSPYEIQENFMKALYHTLDGSKFGIFESRK